jgi:leucyl/phenylalanyl-tRNA--protein transferase
VRHTAVDIVVARATRPSPVGACRFHFPDPRLADGGGLLATGGDFEPATLLAAYRQGIFPWPVDGVDLLWWSPDPRAVLPPDGVHVSRSLARTLRRRRFRVTIDAAFDEVMAGCADRAEDETWITPTIRNAYARLHRLGWAHSVEVWTDGALAGGLYGVSIGALFAAESMFHRASDASKVALVALAQHARAVGVELIDVQMPTPHLTSLGAVTISREQYLQRLARAVSRRVNFVGGRAEFPGEAAVSPVE